jgi:hypothetical protein
VTWRLWGIDAPECRQACADGWPAGRESTAALRRLIEGRAIVCELRGHDRYGRSIGLCRAGGKDLGAELVSAGMAWAFTRYSSDYVREKRAATVLESASMRMTARSLGTGGPGTGATGEGRTSRVATGLTHRRGMIAVAMISVSPVPTTILAMAVPVIAGTV